MRCGLVEAVDQPERIFGVLRRRSSTERSARTTGPLPNLAQNGTYGVGSRMRFTDHINSEVSASAATRPTRRYGAKTALSPAMFCVAILSPSF